MRLNSKMLINRIEQLEMAISTESKIDFIVLVGVNPDRTHSKVIGYSYHGKDYRLQAGETLAELEKRIKQAHKSIKVFIVVAIQEQD